ncbi:hypothetical protein L804_06633 [Cryptococcus deuterogattii 2001/935-1]|nr:hypothetical protein I352_06217 [Cryptococcus deuterogattii MMRL2647]KIR96139.1 hypothetical protein L804_06633 [Cryptococcus deuterogattii 2001/935-1]
MATCYEMRLPFQKPRLLTPFTQHFHRFSARKRIESIMSLSSPIKRMERRAGCKHRVMSSATHVPPPNTTPKSRLAAVEKIQT